jgi:hypothetical protein
MSNAGKWSKRYDGLDASRPYGDITTYELGAEFLDGLLVEDWGCGMGFFRSLIKPELYRGIDGSWTKFCDETVDLETYRSDVQAIFMRHVLEHNYNWQTVLTNALSSFRERMCLILFVPLSDADTIEVGFTPDVGVPDLAISRRELHDLIGGINCRIQELDTDTQYGAETIYFLEKS